MSTYLMKERLGIATVRDAAEYAITIQDNPMIKATMATLRPGGIIVISLPRTRKREYPTIADPFQGSRTPPYYEEMTIEFPFPATYMGEIVANLILGSHWRDV